MPDEPKKRTRAPGAGMPKGKVLVNVKRDEFARFLALGGTSAEAIKKFGVSKRSAYNWRRHPAVKRIIDEIRSKEIKQAVMERDEMLERLSQFARADLGDYFEQDENGDFTVSIKDKDTLPLADISVTNWSGGKDGRATQQTVKLKIKNPMEAMELIAKLQQMYELPATYNDNRTLNIIVGSEKAKHLAETAGDWLLE